jgi:hypothetical protein
MASTAAPAVRTSSPVPTTEKAPHSFQDALKQGWAVVSDKSNQSINQKRREGKLTMQKRGCFGPADPSARLLLEVDYVGAVKGYRFSVPKFIRE